MRFLGKAGVFLLAVFFAAALFLPADQVRAEGFVSIDTDKKYEGMEASFAKGYMPSVRKNTMRLVVPFVAGTALAGDSLLVGVSFEREENSPFVFQNYQKRVKKSGKGVYLYKCNIKLRKDRVNGQYPLRLTVQAQAGEERFQQEFTVYAEISDGKQAGFPGENPGGETGTLEEGASGALEEDGAGAQAGGRKEDGTGAQAGGRKEEVSHQPRVLITQNSLQGTAVSAGGSAAWTVTAKNCSGSQPVENMKVTLLFDGDGVSFEKNAWYFERVSARGSMDLSQEVAAAGKAAGGQVSVQFQFEYEDGKGNAYSSTETASFLVGQAPKAELAGLNFPESIYESDTDTLTFQVQNTGLAVIYNARVRLEAAGLFPEKELFLGNMEAGMSADGEIRVFAGTLDMDENGDVQEEGREKYGDTAASVIFSYENERGEVTEQTLSFHTAIKKPETVELKVQQQEEETNQWWITVLFFAFLVLILIIIWLYLRMKYYQRMRTDG